VTPTSKVAQVWVCPRNKDHPTYPSPVEIVGMTCKECIKNSVKRTDKVYMVLKK
jgi:hypothetical protein